MTTNKPKDGLKPCPFCGGPAELEEVDSGGWSVGCEEKEQSVHYCMGYQSLTSFATKREAIAAWNIRRPPYNGPPCATCGAAHPFGDIFCSDPFHTSPDHSRTPPVEPGEQEDYCGIVVVDDEPMLTPEETDEMVERINANPYLRPAPNPVVERLVEAGWRVLAELDRRVKLSVIAATEPDDIERFDGHRELSEALAALASVNPIQDKP